MLGLFEKPTMRDLFVLEKSRRMLRKLKAMVNSKLFEETWNAFLRNHA